jgi:alkylhydroperoxidase family enzyme
MSLSRALTRRAVAAAERDVGAPLNYLRHIADTSLSAFAKFGLFTPLARHRKHVPPAPYHLARIAAVQFEDCGTCVQIEVNAALKAGVDLELVRATVEGHTDELPAALREVVRFAEAVAAANDDDGLRQAVRARYGEAAFVELALGIASARVFPTTKRALGYAKACALVPIDYEGQPA